MIVQHEFGISLFCFDRLHPCSLSLRSAQQALSTPIMFALVALSSVFVTFNFTVVIALATKRMLSLPNFFLDIVLLTTRFFKSRPSHLPLDLSPFLTVVLLLPQRSQSLFTFPFQMISLGSFE
jgi:hypothetical protein